MRVLAATNRVVEEDVKSRQVPAGPLLPPQRHPHRGAAAARATRGRRRAREALPRALLARAQQARSAASRRTRCARSMRYDFPGNVRELENIVERAVALASGQQIGLGDLPHEVSGALPNRRPRSYASARGMRPRRSAGRARTEDDRRGPRAVRRRANAGGQDLGSHTTESALSPSEAAARGCGRATWRRGEERRGVGLLSPTSEVQTRADGCTVRRCRAIERPAGIAGLLGCREEHDTADDETDGANPSDDGANGGKALRAVCL